MRHKLDFGIRVEYTAVHMAERGEDFHALVIGVGSAGERHVQAQRRLGVTTAIYDANTQLAQDKAIEHGAEAILSIEDALDWADLVHICTPDHLHTDYALQSVEKGCDVLLEKPMTTNLSDALAIQRAVSERGTNLFVGTNMRLTPSFIAIRNEVQAGSIGQLIALDTTYIHDVRDYLQRTPWRKYQNGMYGGGIHAVDLACWVAQEPVKEVQAMTGVKHIPEAVYAVPEDYRVNLKFESGVTAHIWVNHRFPIERHGVDLVAHGTLGQYVAHSKSDSYTEYKSSDQRQTYRTIKAGSVYTMDKEIELIDNWLAGKSDSHWPVPTINEAVEVMRVMDVIDRAVKSGGSERVRR